MTRQQNTTHIYVRAAHAGWEATDALKDTPAAGLVSSAQYWRSRALRAEAQAARWQRTAQRRLGHIRRQDLTLHRAQAIADALHQVWCTGPCRHHAEPLTEELVAEAIRGVRRLIDKLAAQRLRLPQVTYSWRKGSTYCGKCYQQIDGSVAKHQFICIPLLVRETEGPMENLISGTR